jgi:hypothetical protein
VRRLLAAIGCGIFVVAGLGYTVLTIQQTRAVRASVELTTFDPPAKVIICRSGPSSECAAEAAQRTSLAVAWMAPPPGFRLLWLAAVASPEAPSGHWFSFEHLVSERVALELTTQPQLPPHVDADLIGTYTVEDIAVRVYASRYSSSLTLTWMRFGTTYTFWVTPVHMLDQTALDPQAYLQLVATVHYTGHRGPHGKPDVETGPR